MERDTFLGYQKMARDWEKIYISKGQKKNLQVFRCKSSKERVIWDL